MSFKEPWQIFLTEVTPSIHYNYIISAPTKDFERAEEQEHPWVSDKARHNMKNLQECKLLLKSAFQNSPALYF